MTSQLLENYDITLKSWYVNSFKVPLFPVPEEVRQFLAEYSETRREKFGWCHKSAFGKP